MATKALKPTARQSDATAGFGARLRAARQRAGLTLREVSEPSGLSLTYLSDLERGVLSNPTLDKLRAIATTLQISLDSLLDVPTHEGGERPLPAELEGLARSPEFRQAIEEEAQRRGIDAGVLRESWLRALSAINIEGWAPRRPMDYFFVFEAIRRVIER